MARVFLAGLIILVFAFPMTAEGRVIANLDWYAEHATHIVLITEGDRIDGQLKVLESFKGNLKIGEKLTIPELAEFAPLEARAVECRGPLSLHPYTPCTDRPQIYVSCSKMLLFLCQKKNSSSKVKEWSAVGEDGDIISSIVWFEKVGSYRFTSRSKENKGILTNDVSLPQFRIERLVKTKMADNDKKRK